MSAAVNLKEQPDIKEFIYVLESNGLIREQQEVESLVDLLENIGNQFTQMIGELQAVRGELVNMQNKSIRATVSRAVENAEGKTQEILGKIFAIGKNLVCSVKKAVVVFKEKGVDVLRKAVSAMKIPQVLSAIKNLLHNGKERMNGKAEKTQILAQEIYKVKEHRKNIGRILTGRRAKEPTEQAVDRGILAKIQRIFLNCERMYAGMEQKAEKALNCVEEFCREKKSSVKADLRMLNNQKTEQKSNPTTIQEQTR